jgi:hypothetical protein
VADSDENMIEFLKAAADSFKHLTTIATGIIVIVATLLEKLFQHPAWKGLITVSFASLFVAILASLIAANYYIGYMLNPSKYLRDSTKWVTVAFTGLAWGSFLLGVLTLTVFAMRNMS